LSELGFSGFEDFLILYFKINLVDKEGELQRL